LLAEQYRFLAVLLKANGKGKESDHSYRQAEMIVSQAKKVAAARKREPGHANRPHEGKIGISFKNGPGDDDNVSHFSWTTDQTGKSTMSAIGNVSKENIIFKQYA
jgi:hypothetical protein